MFLTEASVMFCHKHSIWINLLMINLDNGGYQDLDCTVRLVLKRKTRIPPQLRTDKGGKTGM
jgi:hypothetical protein